MNINREMINATLLTYNNELDEYGQPRQDVPVETSIQITRPKLYSHSSVEDIRFNDVSDSCLTYNKNISEKNEVKVDEVIYLIKFVNNEGRLSQLFLVKK